MQPEMDKVEQEGFFEFKFVDYDEAFCRESLFS